MKTHVTDSFSIDDENTVNKIVAPKSNNGNSVTTVSVVEYTHHPHNTQDAQLTNNGYEPQQTESCSTTPLHETQSPTTQSLLTSKVNNTLTLSVIVLSILSISSALYRLILL